MAELLGELVIRRAKQSDVGMVAALRALRSTGIECSAAFERRMADWLASERDHRTAWLAWIGDLPVVMASMLEYRRMPHPGRPDSRWGYIGNVFVRADARGRGVGTALLDEIASAARARGYVRLVLSPSEPAMSFFRRAGFVSSEQTAFDCCWSDGVSHSARSTTLGRHGCRDQVMTMVGHQAQQAHRPSRVSLPEGRSASV